MPALQIKCVLCAVTVSYTHLDVYKRQVLRAVKTEFGKFSEVLAKVQDKLHAADSEL